MQFLREAKQAGPGVFIRKDKDREKMDLLLRGELEGMLR